MITAAMKKPVHSVTMDESVIVAAKRMRDAGIGFLPVLDQEGGLAGMITERDITWQFVADQLSPSTPVSEIMERSVPTCRARHDLFEAQKIMRERHARRIVCLDDDGRLAGVLTLTDIAQHEDGFRLAKTVQQALPPRSVRGS